MASVTYFEETISDKEDKDATLEIEMGTSSYYGEKLMAVRVGEMTVLLDHEKARELCAAVENIAINLGYRET